MTAGGFTERGLAALDAALARHVTRGEVPGVVALVARGGQVHVTVAGDASAAADGQPAEPMARDSLFRIASLTKPVVGAAAMLLIQDGAMALGDPVTRWLPELSGRRVLRRLDGALDDTVPARREITVQDVLSFRLGFGAIMAPGPFPVAQAEAALGLQTLGPPWPPTRLPSGQWIAGLASLPLMDQPGERFRYNTGATVAGILIERLTGAPLGEVLAKRVLEPLGMPDTAFDVPAAKRGRFTSLYAPPHYAGGVPGTGGDQRALVDGPAGWYSAPPALADAASGLISTVDDLWAFTSMLARGGAGLLSEESVALMLRDRTTPQDRADNPWFFGEHAGWGLMVSVPAGRDIPGGLNPAGEPRGYGWDGGSGTTWRTDPASGLTGILLSQLMMGSPEPPALYRDFWRAAYAALDG